MRTSLRYIDEFLALRCVPDLLASGVFPRRPAKEITEVMGAWRAVREALPRLDLLRDSDVVLLDVGCGVRPRGAALAAFLSAWTTVGVDPRLRKPGLVPGVMRCLGSRATIDEFLVSNEWRKMARNASLVVVLNIHGHAGLGYLDRIDGPCICVAIPCCFHLVPPRNFILVSRKEDRWITSPKREVSIWTRGISRSGDGR